MNLPLWADNPHVFAHIGNVEAILKDGVRLPSKRQMCSLEGLAFSVSLHPEDWVRIAGLSRDTLALRFDPPALDFHKWRKGRRSQEIPELTRFGLDHGWITKRNDVLMWKLDTEDDQEWYTTLPEGDPYIPAASEDAIRVETRPGWEYTPKMIKRMSKFYAEPNDECMEPEVLNLWLAEEHPHIGMVWYNDHYDPDSLSAPRGAILPHHFQSIIPLAELNAEDWESWLGEYQNS